MNAQEKVEADLIQLFIQARAQFGDAVKAYWFNESERCPACSRPVDVFKMKGKESMSLNAFIYRQKGVLIGYFLCGRCAKQIFNDAKRNPYQQTAVHERIETNLKQAYIHHMSSMDA